VTNIGQNEPASVSRDQLGKDSVILDVREDDEWAGGHIDGAVHVPLDRLANRMTYEPGELLSDDPIVVTCKGGGRARRAAAWLNSNGFDALVLDGGMLGWQADGRPMVSDTGEPPVVR
jgi:rhodanese-related sulfurtransferase